MKSCRSLIFLWARPQHAFTGKENQNTMKIQCSSYSTFLISRYLKSYWQPCHHCLHQSYQFHVEGRFSQPFSTKDIRHRNMTKGSFCLIFWIRKSLVGQDKESFPVIFKNQMASSLGSLWQHSKKWNPRLVITHWFSIIIIASVYKVFPFKNHHGCLVVFLEVFPQI